MEEKADLAAIHRDYYTEGRLEIMIYYNIAIVSIPIQDMKMEHLKDKLEVYTRYSKSEHSKNDNKWSHKPLILELVKIFKEEINKRNHDEKI